jgi:hypothetical protein
VPPLDFPFADGIQAKGVLLSIKPFETIPKKGQLIWSASPAKYS